MGAMINEDRFGVVSLTIDVANVLTITTAEQDFTVTGLKVGDFVAVSKPSLSAGLGICNARVKAADTLSIQFVNPTAAGVNPASETYLVFWFRPEKTPVAVVNP